MAELLNLERPDRELSECGERLKEIAKAVGGGSEVLSSEQLSKLAYEMAHAIDNLHSALVLVLHNNREGRGTRPGRGTPRSMMERAR